MNCNNAYLPLYVIQPRHVIKCRLNYTCVHALLRTVHMERTEASWKELYCKSIRFVFGWCHNHHHYNQRVIGLELATQNNYTSYLQL
jgi:hypothetical protein